MGSEFVILLPLASKQSGPIAKNHQEGVSVSNVRRRILVVDDNLDSATSLSMLLKTLGAEVWTVNDGQAALEALKSINPSVLFLDIGMPGMDGYEVARAIRQQAECRDVTLVAVSGWGYQEDRVRSKAAGIDYHLVKPVDPNVVRNLLSSLPWRPQEAVAPVA
jgi:CheY-like chemotaxis protein